MLKRSTQRYRLFIIFIVLICVSKILWSWNSASNLESSALHTGPTSTSSMRHKENSYSSGGGSHCTKHQWLYCLKQNIMYLCPWPMEYDTNTCDIGISWLEEFRVNMPVLVEIPDVDLSVVADDLPLQERVTKICQSLPGDGPQQINRAFLKQHRNQLASLYINKKHRFLYCWIPKVASSQGTDFLNRLGVGEGSSMQLVKLPDDEIVEVLTTYYKFMFVGEPRERLLSFYYKMLNSLLISAVEEAMQMGNTNWYYDIMKMLNISSLNFSATPWPSFADLIHYYFEDGGMWEGRGSPHVWPYVDMCQPCWVRYDFIGRYETMREESEKILRHLKLKSSHIYIVDHPQGTREQQYQVEQHYNSLLSPEWRRRVEEVYYKDRVMFGYA